MTWRACAFQVSFCPCTRLTFAAVWMGAIGRTRPLPIWGYASAVTCFEYPPHFDVLLGPPGGYLKARDWPGLESACLVGVVVDPLELGEGNPDGRGGRLVAGDRNGLLGGQHHESLVGYLDGVWGGLAVLTGVGRLDGADWSVDGSGSCFGPSVFWHPSPRTLKP